MHYSKEDMQRIEHLRHQWRNQLLYSYKNKPDEELKAIEGNYTVVPNVTGVELSEAIGMIGGKELKYSRPESAKGDDNFIIKDQYPKAGTKVKRGSVVYIYKE